MQYPLNYVAVTQSYHQGKAIDFGWNSANGGCNQPIFAIEDGQVIYKTKQLKGGWVYRILHDNGMVSEYAHLKDKTLTLNVGDYVKKGKQIALMGNSGSSADGYHLHFCIYKTKKISSMNCLPLLDYLFMMDNQECNDKTKIKYQPLRYGETMTCTTKSLRVRNKPSLTGKTMGYLTKGDQVKVYDRVGDWYKLAIGQEKYSHYKYFKR